jgi:hypothetical protein
LDGFTGNSTQSDKYELLQISSCADKHCATKLTEGYVLNLSIRSTDPQTPVSTGDHLVEDIEAIIRTIQI